MSMTDPIADLLTRIRNGLKADKISVDIPASRSKKAILNVLKEEGYLTDFAEKEVGGKAVLEIMLKYYDGKPVIENIQRVSRPGRRVYRKQGDLPTIIGGLGISIISTSRGIMTATQARETGIGGEVLCSVY